MSTALNGTIKLDSISQILLNLRKDPDAYNHGMTEDMWMQECNREDVL